MKNTKQKDYSFILLAKNAGIFFWEKYAYSFIQSKTNNNMVERQNKRFCLVLDGADVQILILGSLQTFFFFSL